jgi:hypothetical protein
MHKWTKWLPVVAVLLLVVVIGSMAGCAPSKPAAAPAPAPAPAPQTTAPPPTPAPPTAKGTADLVVNDLWQEQSQVYYKVANLGNGESKGGTARLYVEGQEKDHDYVEPLSPGQEIIAKFYGWSFIASDLVAGMDQPRPSMHVRVCLDTENATAESSEANNCLEKVIGMPYVFDFALYATSAEWKSGNDPLK